MTDTNSTSIETWAIVEIMGHNKAAGFVKTEPFGGTVMLRIEIPELPERKEEVTSWNDADGAYTGKLQKFDKVLPAEAARTEFVGMSSIFRLRPCTEETARAAVDKMRVYPPKLLHLGPATEPSQLPGPSGRGDDSIDEDDRDLDLDDDNNDEGFGG